MTMSAACRTVRQRRVVDVVGLVLALLLVGRRAFEQLTGVTVASEQAETGDLGSMALDEDRAALGIEAEGQQSGRHLAGLAAEAVGVVGS